MFRRPRFSVKPNVRPNAAGRSSNSGGSTGSVVPGVAASDGDGQHGSAPITRSPAAKGSSTLQTGAPASAADSGDFHLSEDSNDSKRNEKTSDTSGDGNSKKHTEIFPQRRKRISTMPNLIKPRITPPSTHCPAGLGSKCSQKQVPPSPTIGNSVFQKESSSSENINVENSPKSPILPEKKTPVPQVPQFSPFKKSAGKETSECVSAQRSDEALQKNTCSPLKERPTQERLMQEETTQSKSVSANKKRMCSDCEKIIKTQKLRKMLKEELKKEKKQQKFTYPVTEKHMPEDRSKMIMRDFIYYLPENNPMKSSLVEEKKTEKTSTVTQANEPEERVVAGHEDENEEDTEEGGGGGGEDDGSLLVPRVKVAEDGSIILDEESLTVEVLRTKGQCVVEENDPIFERGSTTTYSSFRKSYYTRPWSEKETDMFFLAISMVGTDFSMISQLFPHRARTEIKNKFKREEKVNGWRIDKAFKEKRPFDFSLFTKLLEKVLENERKKKDKDARCERQKEKNTNKRNTPKSQKKQKDKTVNRQSNHNQDEYLNASTSDVEIEVDAETAEKENEESPSILEQVEGQTAVESTMTKKRRKRRKKDSDQEAENLLEERTVPAEMTEEERTRKKRKITSTDEVVEELEVPNGIIPDEAFIADEEVPPCRIKLNEEAERDHSIQGRKSGCVEQLSVSQMPPKQNAADSGETNETENEVAEIDKLGKSQNMSSQNNEEIILFPGKLIEQLLIEGQLQKVASGLAGASEKKRASNKEIQKAFVETEEVRGRLQRLNPNIVKVSGKKEAPAQDKLNNQEPKDTIEKEKDQNEAAHITTVDITETDCQGLVTESEVNKQYTSQENNKQTVLKPAALARARFQRPKPNLGRVARRQEELGRNTKAEEKASETPTETEKILMQTECNDNQLPDKDITEATTTTVASIEKVNSAYSNQSPVPLECEHHNLRNTTLPLDSIMNVADLVSRDSSLQEEQKENVVEIDHSSESSPSSLKENLENASERKHLLHTVKHKSETIEESSVNLTDECNETSNLNNLSEIKSDTANEASLAPDSHKKESVGKQSSQEIKQSDIRSTRLARGRFQRPKPNIGRVIGRKGMRSLEGNEVTTMENLGLQKSESTTSSSVVTQLKCDDKILPVKASDSRLLNSEEIIQEDSQDLGTFQNSSDQCSRENFAFQENKLYTVKPARLARGRFQRTRLNLERVSCKKEEPASKNVGTPVGEKEMIEKDDLSSTLEDDVSVQAPLDNLGRKEGLEAITISSKSCTNQKNHPSFEKLVADGLLKNQEPVCVSKDDIKRKNLDIIASDIFAPQEINQAESMMDHHLQKLQSNVAQITKNREASLEGENSTEGQTGRDADCDATSDDNKSQKMVELLNSSGHLMESASDSELWRGKKCIESSESIFPPRSRHSRKHDPSDQLSGSQIKKEIPKSLSVQEREAEILKGKQPRRTLKQRNKNCNSKTLFTSECENDHCRKVKHYQKVKPHISRGRNLKPGLRKKTRKEYGNSKVNLVTLRASSQEDEEDEDEDEPESDYEVESFLPEEVNKAPVFVPKGLRSPNPVPIQTEETMEELEIYENVAEEPYLSHDLIPSIQPMIQEDKELHFSPLDITQEDQKSNTGINDGSTEAAMTLLAMRDPVFQLRSDTQEKMQEFLNKDEPSCAASFPDEGNEVQTVVSSKNELFSSNNINNTAIEGKRTEPSGFKSLEEKTIVLLSDSSYNVFVTSHDINKTTTEYQSLEEGSQETTRVCSKVSLCNSSKPSRPARYRFPKPKPNLHSGLALCRNTSQNSLGLSSSLEESKEIQNEVRLTKKYVEEQNVELHLQVDEQLARISTAGTHELHSENVGPAVQKNNMESGNPIEEIWGITSELIAPKSSQEAGACPPEVSDNPNLKSNVEASGPVEHHFSVADIAQTERNKNPSISAVAEMSTVSCGFTEVLDAEEEPKFILTLVEISADSLDCSGSLPQGSEELLPAPVLSTSNNMHLLELTRDESVGYITVSAEENAASIKDTTESGLETEQLTDLGLTSWTSLKSSSVTLEDSGASEEKISTVPVDEHLKSSDKGTSLKYIPRKSAEKSSEKCSSSKKKITPSSEPIPQTTDQPAEEREQPQTSPNMGVFLLDEAAGTAGNISRTLSARKIEIIEEQRLFVDTYSSVQSDKAGKTEVLSKTPLSRSYQRSLGFLPLICNMNADGEVAAKGNKSLQKTCTLFSEDIAECPASSSKDNNGKIQEYSSLPSATLSPSKYKSGSCSAVQDEGSPKKQDKEEEPTRVSEYFFSDIFMEVDDSE